MTDPATIVAVIPSLLGFTPEHSAVIIGLGITPSGHPCIVATARVDLPEPEEDEDTAAWSDWLADTVDTLIERSNTLLCVIWDGGLPEDVRERAEAAHASLARAGAHIGDVLVVHAGRWWSLMCESSRCCPEAGRLIEPGSIDRGCAMLGLPPCEPAESRRDLESELSFASLRGDWPKEPPDIPDGAFEVAVAHTVNTLASGSPCQAENLVLIGIALSDVRVRDTVIWDVLSNDRRLLAPAIEVLSEAVRSAPDYYVAPLAACVGLFQWQYGDGIRACIAVHRSLDANPEYSFAHLLLQCLAR
jgi:hypothetical protein